MKIATSMVSLSAHQTDISTSSKFSYLRKWDKNSETIESSHIENEKQASISSSLKDRLEISPERMQMYKQEQCKIQEKDKDLIDECMDDFYGDIRLKIFKDLVEIFTGKEIKVFRPGEQADSSENENVEDDISSSAQAPSSSDTPETAGWGIDYYYKETRYEKNGFSVEAAGKVLTENGKEINFSTSLSMGRETYEEITVSLKAGDALIDPLIVDFTGTGTTLTNKKFNFDLNIDGIIDSISAPGKGSGFLAYDKNGDGIINDGSELFGPSSGDGFSELAALDDDNNGWIDENDQIFSKLGIWEKHPDNTERLSGLLDNNIGAIYTGRVDTKYDLLNSNNALSGSIRQTGVWLNEKSGAAGIIQEIDLVV